MRRRLERRRTGKAGWLRAAVLGADDGILSTASLMLGVAAAHGSRGDLSNRGGRRFGCGSGVDRYRRIRLGSLAGRIPRQPSLAFERTELGTNDEGEHRELAEIYIGRGLEPALAKQVAVQLMARNALEAHARDELGIRRDPESASEPGGIASAVSFSVGAAVPLIAAAADVAIGDTLRIFAVAGRAPTQRERVAGSSRRPSRPKPTPGVNLRRGGRR